MHAPFGCLASLWWCCSGSIEFPEVVRAIRLAEIDPIVHNLFGMALAPNARVLAQSYLRRGACMCVWVCGCDRGTALCVVADVLGAARYVLGRSGHDKAWSSERHGSAALTNQWQRRVRA